MAVRTTSWLAFPSLLRTLVTHGRLAWRLVKDPAVPLLVKLLPLAGALYLVSPIDGVPDFIPILGQLDDIGMVLVALEAFLKLCPDHVVAFHRSAVASGRAFTPAPATGTPSSTGPVIDAEFRREDDRR